MSQHPSPSPKPLKSESPRSGAEATGASCLRNLEWWEIRDLESRLCNAENWEYVRIGQPFDLRAVCNVEFRGHVDLLGLDTARRPESAIANSCLSDCSVGLDPLIEHVGLLKGVRVGDSVTLLRDGEITMRPGAVCGIGSEVAVLDETGSRPVTIYPGLSAQMAILMARVPRRFSETLGPAVRQHCSSLEYGFDIGDRARVLGCGCIEDVRIWPGVTVEGALSLKDGSIVSNAPAGVDAIAYVGKGVSARGFIVEDGVLDTCATAENTYIGQGAEVSKGFTSHDSLFFANSMMENGEACAVIAGPYSVSMHKSTLLIGCVTSFMNAGSATNQSNHMYKLGPVHWGVLERGVKTSSNSYLMLGAKIGAFSLLMGDHKTHPDSSEFPFSYLFGDEKGSTVVVPAMMLRSCGLMRDELKWPARDKRAAAQLPLIDRIHFPVLNPHTVSHILKALDTIDMLMQRPADDDRYVRYKGMKFSRASLERARQIYTLAIYKYLHVSLGDSEIPCPEYADAEAPRWIDLCGQLIRQEDLERVFEARSVEEAEAKLDEAFRDFSARERQWMGLRFGKYWRERQHRFALEAERYDEMVEEDRRQYRENLRAESEMLRLL